MRYFIFSDVHSNLEAFDAVLSAIAEEQVDRIVFLGDIVGYGAQPNEVVDRLRELKPDATVRGNHDKVIAGIEDGSSFQELARASAMWSRLQIRPDNKAYLRCIPQGPITLEKEIQISHGSPHDEDFYIVTHWDARPILHQSESWIVFYGHTHLPMIFSTESRFSQCYPEDDEFYYRLLEDEQYLINPGSSAKPGRSDPLVSRAISIPKLVMLSLILTKTSSV